MKMYEFDIRISQMEQALISICKERGVCKDIQLMIRQYWFPDYAEVMESLKKFINIFFLG